MKKSKKITIGIFLLVVVVIAFIVIMINNPNISTIQRKEKKEQLATEDGLISTKDHLNEIAKIEGSLKTETKLLWTNSSPTSAFTAQTLPIDLSEYDAIIVDVVYAATYINDYRTMQVFPKNGNTYSLLNGYYGANGAWVRNITVNDDGVIIGNSKDNITNIPGTIYGIKGITGYPVYE